MRFDASRKQVHRRIADEACHPHRRRPAPQLLRRGDLLDAARVDDGNAIRDRQRFHRIGRAPERRRWPRRDDAADLGAQLVAQLGVEMGDRLVEQRHGGPLDEGARERDPLLLAAGQLGRQPRTQVAYLEEIQQDVDAADVGPATVRRDQRRHHVLPHRQVRIKRVGLEHVGDAARGRRNRGDIPPGDAADTRVRCLETRDDPAERRLAGSRRTGDGKQFARARRQRNLVQRPDGGERLGNVAQLDLVRELRRCCGAQARMDIHDDDSRLRPSALANR